MFKVKRLEERVAYLEERLNNLYREHDKLIMETRIHCWTWARQDVGDHELWAEPMESRKLTTAQLVVKIAEKIGYEFIPGTSPTIKLGKKNGRLG